MNKKSKIKFFEILDTLEEEQKFFEYILKHVGVDTDLLDSANSMIDYLEEAWKQRPSDMNSIQQARLADLLAKSRKLRDNIIMLIASVGEVEADGIRGLVGEA